jgi:hypothetical protein
LSKNVKKLSKISQKPVKNLSKNVSIMFLKNLSIIFPFAQIVRGRRRRRRRRRRLVASRPGGDFIAPGKKFKNYHTVQSKMSTDKQTPLD